MTTSGEIMNVPSKSAQIELNVHEQSYNGSYHDLTHTLTEVDISRLIDEYVNIMELSSTNDCCWCAWIIHPDDAEKPVGARRKRRADEHPNCPLHTRTGYLNNFFSWLHAKYGNCDD